MTGRLPSWARVAVALAVLCVAGAFGYSRIASAAPDHRVQVAVGGSGFTARPAVGLFDVTGLAPGQTTSDKLGVRTGSADTSQLSLGLIDVENDENGCAETETATDKTCRDRQGELGRAAVFTLSVATARNATYQKVWTGRLASLQRGVDTGATVADGRDQWVRLATTLPASVGNVVEGDGLRFGIRITLRSTLGVAAVSIDRPGKRGEPNAPPARVSTAESDAVALTGVPLALLLSAALLLLTAGVLTAGAARVRRPAKP